MRKILIVLIALSFGCNKNQNRIIVSDIKGSPIDSAIVEIQKDTFYHSPTLLPVYKKMHHRFITDRYGAILLNQNYINSLITVRKENYSDLVIRYSEIKKKRKSLILIMTKTN
jgi:hypothetical protein